MGFFDLFKHKDINQGVAQFQQTSNAMLVDVRTPEEYREGHIPGSINVPCSKLRTLIWKFRICRLPSSSTAAPEPEAVRPQLCGRRWGMKKSTISVAFSTIKERWNCK